MQPAMNYGQPAARNQFVSDVSGADLSALLGPVSSSGQLSVEFFYRQVRIEDPMNPADHGQFRTVLCVRRRPHGDRLTESTRMITERLAQQLYPREFAFFKQNQDVPTDGTPLSELPGISQSQIAILVIHNIRCVEDLVGLNPDQVAQIGMDARQAYAIAHRWTEARTNNAGLIHDASKEAAMTAEIERLRAAEAGTMATIQQLQAQIEILSKMTGAPAATVAHSGSTKAQLVDADDLPDASDESPLFSGAQMVVGNDDLDEPAPALLPGLERKKR